MAIQTWANRFIFNVMIHSNRNTRSSQSFGPEFRSFRLLQPVAKIQDITTCSVFLPLPVMSESFGLRIYETKLSLIRAPISSVAPGLHVLVLVKMYWNKNRETQLNWTRSRRTDYCNFHVCAFCTFGSNLPSESLPFQNKMKVHYHACVS